MIIFGVDIPLLEVIVAFAIIALLLLLEAIVIITLLSKHLAKTRKVAELVEKLSEIMLEIKKKEIEELDLIRRKR